MDSQRTRIGFSVIAVTLPLLVYLFTLAREITFVDSGELAAVAVTLGIAHPPGYPLFALLGRLFSLIPAGSPAWRVGLLSAVAMALTAGLTYRAAVAGLRRLDLAGWPAAALAPLAGALLFAFAKTPWSLAVVVEVYALQVLLVMSFLALVLHALAEGDRAKRFWPLATFLALLALSNHLTGLLLLPTLVAFYALSLFRRGRGKHWSGLPIVQTLAAAVLPLLLYLYLPLRSRQGPAVSWDFPETWDRLLVHVTARQYQGLLGSQGWRSEELGRFLNVQLPAESGWGFGLLAALGLLFLIRRAWPAALLTGLTCASHLAYNMAYPIHDIRLYYLPVLAICGLWAAVGAGWLVGLAGRFHRLAGPALALLLCLSCLVPLKRHWRDNDQRRFPLLANYARDILVPLKPDAVLFSGRWDSFSSPAIYYQQVMGIRPDVLVLDMGSLASPTLTRQLERRAPELAEACRERLAAVAAIGLRSERGQPVDIASARRDYELLRRSLVEQARRRGPTYLTSELKNHGMFLGYETQPAGLVYRLLRAEEEMPLPELELLGPGLAFTQLRNAQEDQVHGDYMRMLKLRADALKTAGRTEEAQACWELLGELAK